MKKILVLIIALFLITFCDCLFAMRGYEDRRNYFRQLENESKSSNKFDVSAFCVLKYLDYYQTEPRELHFTEFSSLFHLLQEKAQVRPLLPEDVTNRLTWNYEHFPAIIGAAKSLKRELKKTQPSYGMEKYFRQKLQEADCIIQMIKQFNKGKTDPQYGVPQL